LEAGRVYVVKRASMSLSVDFTRDSRTWPSVQHNDYHYMSLDGHTPGATGIRSFDDQLHQKQSGWELCPYTPDALHVCAQHPWQANFLVFADGSVCATKQGTGLGYTPRKQIATNGLKTHKADFFDDDSALWHGIVPFVELQNEGIAAKDWSSSTTESYTEYSSEMGGPGDEVEVVRTMFKADVLMRRRA
jgi:hypothetical protein